MALLILPSILGMTIFFIIPFVWMIYLSFNEVSPQGRSFGLGNYIGLFGNSSFKLAVNNTVLFTIISVPLIIAVSLLLAIMLNKKIKFKRQLRTSFVIPLVVPTASIILFFEMIFDTKGLINAVVKSFGFDAINWLNSEYALFVIVTMFIWKNVGYNIILFWSGLQNIPKEYYEAASIDGASAFQKFFRITLIYLMPTTFFVLIISIINSFKVFKEIYLMAGAYPHQSIYMLQHFMNNLFFKLDYYKLVSAAIIMMIVIASFVFVMFKIQNRISEVIDG